MGRKWEQSNENKEKFKSEVLAYMLLDPKRVYTKQELSAHFEMSERAIRMELERIANFYPVRASAGKKGYSLIQINDDSNFEELMDANAESHFQIKEIEHRIEALKARLKPLIAMQIETSNRIMMIHEKGE